MNARRLVAFSAVLLVFGLGILIGHFVTLDRYRVFSTSGEYARLYRYDANTGKTWTLITRQPDLHGPRSLNWQEVAE